MNASRRAWFESYVSTVLSRDVREVANIEGLTQLPRLLGLLASRSGALLNYSEHFKGLHALEEDAGERFVRGIILYNGKRTVSFSERMADVPISALGSITCGR